jgi:glycosyltransferase involved in cell wall biosynthesis
MSASTYATLGVVAISYNEEEDLPGFLQHLVGWVDEIIVVDDGSTDDTAWIAQQYGPKVKFLELPRIEGEYYADQRNKGIDAAKSDWLLHMDIDERVTPHLAREILDAINGEKKAYRFRRLNYFLHRPMTGGGWADWNLVHLAKRDVLRFSGMFHEHIVLNVEDEEVGQLTEKMHHLNDTSYEERLKKSLNYQWEVVENLKSKKIKISGFNLVIAMIKEFFYKYFYKSGFRDGVPGLISALHSAFAQFRAYTLLWDQQNSIYRNSLEEVLKSEWEVNPLEK